MRLHEKAKAAFALLQKAKRERKGDKATKATKGMTEKDYIR